MNIPLSIEIAMLWLVYLTAMSAHNHVALLPIFAGLDASDESMRGKPVNRAAWMSVMITIVPMLLILALLLFDQTALRWINALFALLFLLLNSLHLLQHVKKKLPDQAQNLLLGVVLLNSAILAYLSVIWLKT